MENLFSDSIGDCVKYCDSSNVNCYDLCTNSNLETIATVGKAPKHEESQYSCSQMGDGGDPLVLSLAFIYVAWLGYRFGSWIKELIN